MSMVCAVRYVLPFLRTSLSLLPKPLWFARLSEPVTFDPALTYFLPVALHTSPANGDWLAQPLPGSGSADFTNLLAVDGFAELPTDETHFPASTVVRIHSLSWATLPPGGQIRCIDAMRILYCQEAYVQPRAHCVFCIARP